jgi:hypothetical protein
LADVRKSKFRTNDRTTQYASLGGNYSSDHNSKEYKISGGYQYRKNHLMLELDLLQHSRYSSTTTTPLTKNRELYDFEASGKVLVGQSDNYLNYYNRSKHDKFSDYYYDITNVGGWGRMFFDGMIEADINIGYNEIKNFDSHIVVNPNIKFSFWITDKLRFTSKAFIFKIKDEYSEELKNRLSYRLNKKISLDIYHNYEKKRFLKTSSGVSNNKNEVERDFIFRVRYSF